MQETKVVKLKKPLATHAGPIKQIVIREPTFDEYMVFGDPYTVAGGSDGTPFAVENIEVIKQYLGICLVEPKDPALLAQAGASVARKVKNTLLSFFPDAEGEDAASETAPTTSSSAATDANPTASKA